MRKRFIYVLLFLVPGLFVSLLVTVAVFGAAYGGLWLFVFGDGTWPAWTGRVMPVLMLALLVSLWLFTGVAGYVFGKKREAVPGFEVRHVGWSLAAALLAVGVALLHQWSIGNLGPISDWERCSAYCSDLGYRSSGTMPGTAGERICSCLGQYGEAEVTVPIAELPR
jgi:hypothetical protein